MSETFLRPQCLRWGRAGDREQCLLISDHLGQCVTRDGPTLGPYASMSERLHRIPPRPEAYAIDPETLKPLEER